MRRRKREQTAEWSARLEAEEAEQRRREGRSMWEKINDADSIHDLKEVLHEIAEHLNL